METVSVENERLARLVDMVNDSDLSSIKTNIVRIIRQINNPKSTARDLKKIIRIDPPLTAKVLRVANSSFYAPEKPIEDIGKAVIWIGYDTVKELALRQKACKLFDKDEILEGYQRSALWTYSVATAYYSRLIYSRVTGQDTEAVYSAGLLHKIGLIAEEQFLRKAFVKMLQVMNQKGVHLIHLEKKLLGFNHAELGAAIARKWHLPETLTMSIAYHTEPFQAPEEYVKPAAVLYIAAMQCHFAEIGYYQATLYDDALYNACLEKLELEPDDIEELVQNSREELNAILQP